MAILLGIFLTHYFSNSVVLWLYFIVQTLVEEEDGIVKPNSQADTSQVGSALKFGLQFEGIVRQFDLGVRLGSFDPL
jgi:hypothetical protein